MSILCTTLCPKFYPVSLQHFSYMFCLFVWFDSLRTINNLSVKQGPVFLGWTSTKLGYMCLAQRPQRGDPGEAQTRGPSVSSQALYHWPTALHLVISMYSKTCLKGHSKIYKTMVLMENGSLMKVESIAECSPWSNLQYFWPALSDNRSWKPIFVVFLSDHLRQVLLYFQSKWKTMWIVIRWLHQISKKDKSRLSKTRVKTRSCTKFRLLKWFLEFFHIKMFFL